MSNILVLCTGNSCRSQMAEGFLRHYLNSGHTVHSAGIEKHGMNKKAMAVMKDAGIDLSDHYSKLIEELPEINYDLVITVCDNASEACPLFPQKTTVIHKNFTDPSKISGSEKEIHKAFIQCRNQIDKFCNEIAAMVNTGKF